MDVFLLSASCQVWLHLMPMASLFNGMKQWHICLLFLPQVPQKTKKTIIQFSLKKSWFYKLKINDNDDVNPPNSITRKTLKQKRSGDLTLQENMVFCTIVDL